ncbi:MAG: hypothetical protein M3Z04_06295 [Chloroflexota bacterium]|nr:hypothetical protein [Chloroflexota bacterium]
MLIRPSMMPTAACAANTWPCSSARNSTTGAEVSGSPTSQPLTSGPQRRPARLTPTINNGVSTSFSSSTPFIGTRGAGARSAWGARGDRGRGYSSAACLRRL